MWKGRRGSKIVVGPYIDMKQLLQRCKSVRLKGGIGLEGGKAAILLSDEYYLAVHGKIAPG